MASGEMSIDALIQAAQFLDGQEQSPRNRSRAHRNRNKKPTTYSRTTHNLLEKNRRAQLRDCLEVLRQHVPLPDKLTTLALLQSAKKYIEGLQLKEREDIEAKMKLQHQQTVLLSRLAELGASHVKCLLSVKTHESTPPPLSLSPSSPTLSNSESFDSASSLPCTSSKGKGRRSLSLSDDPDVHVDEEESVVIDVLTHDSDDETSSTTSGSDGGCTATTHKIQIAV